jgi:predicted ArsR family transcriptional regulator
MPGTRLYERFFSSTRGRIVTLLRRQSSTVDELAQEIGLTDNAVRAHLATLERDGLVRQGGPRRGVGKPAYMYLLTGDADQLFPKPHGAVLKQLLDVLVEQISPAELEGTLREVGRRIAADRVQNMGELPERLEAAAALLNDLGGLAEVEGANGSRAIVGHSCPLGDMVADRPEVCALAETLVSEVVRMPVVERCDRGEQPRCRFEVSFSASQ